MPSKARDYLGEASFLKAQEKGLGETVTLPLISDRTSTTATAGFLFLNFLNYCV